MTWVQIRHATEATWHDHRKVAAVIGDEMAEAGPPPTEWLEVEHAVGS